ncbi:MAG: Crp/Fnr family transcriptional regulator [Hyphomicrobiaceae bacterium]|nr:Crp/Fnr family transcriptional regulator [Hyphomicrobiaceae bacterium]
MTMIYKTQKPDLAKRTVPPSMVSSGVVIALRPRQRLGLARGSEQVFVVRSGMVYLEAMPQATSRQILDLYYPGDVIKEQSIPQIPGANLIAVQTGEVVRLNAQRLQALVEGDPDARRFLDNAMAHQYPRRLAHLAMLGALTGEERVASLLMELALRVGEAGPDRARTFDIPLSRTEMADYLSLNADTLSRIMSKLRQTGVLGATGRGRGYAPHFDALCRITPLAETITALHVNRPA